MRKKAKLVVAMLICSILVGGMRVEAVEGVNVHIPNKYLQKLINVTLKKEETAPITKQEMESLTKLDTTNIPSINGQTQIHTHGISDLTGLEYAVNLEELNLKENEITDLSPIAKLQKLKKLDVHRNKLTDITPLKELKNLEYLDIYNNEIRDILPLASLKNLTFLDMHYVNRQTAKIDITPLAELKNLNYLSLESNLIQDISCLKPLVDSGNLRTILVRVNNITDFTVLKPLLNELYIDNFGSSDELMIGTVNQKASGEPLEVHMAKEGGTVEIPLPEIKGFEDVDTFWAEMMGMPTIKTVTFLEDIEGASVTYNLEKNVAVIEMDENVVGNKKDILANLQIAYEMTDFTYYMPIHLTQDVQYGFLLNIADLNRVNLHMDTRNNLYVSDEALVGKVVDSNGNPVQLQNVSVAFSGTIGMGSNKFDQGIFEAYELKTEGNTISFKIAGKTGVEIPEGNYTLQPTITFQVAGDDTVYQIPNKFKIYNLYVSSTDPLNLGNNIVFDLSQQPNAEGKYTSRKYEVKLPNNREISWITVSNSKGEQVYTSSRDPEWQAGEKTGFALTLAPEEMKDVFYVRIQPASLKRDSQIEILNMGTKFVYSKKDAQVEERFHMNLQNSVEVGKELDLNVSYGEELCKDYTVTSSDEKVLQVAGNKVKAVGEGKAVLKFTGLSFPYEIAGTMFWEVEYENAVQKNLTVTRVQSSGEEGKPSVPKPQGQAGKPAGKGEDAGKPQTGDGTLDTVWVMIGIAAITVLMWNFQKKRVLK